MRRYAPAATIVFGILTCVVTWEASRAIVSGAQGGLELHQMAEPIWPAFLPIGGGVLLLLLATRLALLAKQMFILTTITRAKRKSA